MKQSVQGVLFSLLIATRPGGAAEPAATGKVEVSVVDGAGDSLEGTKVTFAGPVTRAATTATNGKVEIALPPGTYRASAQSAGFATSRQDVTVTSGGTTTASFTLAPGFGDVVVVTASKQETDLVDAPATMTVIDSQQIATTPGANYGDLLRSVPGLNVTQLSARDVEVASRQTAATLSNTQLALVDGRTIYTDFFGLVFWDLVPTDPTDIKQIEVIRGPASAVWGANAATGVVNIVTKTPREATGTTVVLTGGAFSRDAGDTAGEGVGAQFGASASYAAAPNDRWSYRASAGYFQSDALPRPTGQIPIAPSPLNPSVSVGGGSYEDVPFKNEGTKQPKFDLRVNEALDGGAELDYSAGIAGSRGIIHSPIGPFLLQKNSYLGYGKVGYVKNALHLTLFGNFLDGDAPNLISVDPLGNVITVDFRQQTYDVEFGNATSVGTRNVLTYGGNLRRNDFNITLTPEAKSRTEVGAYVQDEVLLNHFRLAASGRVDKFGNLADPFFSTRVLAMFKPTASQSLRISFNRAFRAPSVIDNYLDLSTLGGEFPLGAIDPQLNGLNFPIIVHTIGSTTLKPELLHAYEVAYTGTFGGRTTVGAAFYLNDSDNNISSIQTNFSSENPPPGWPLPPQVLDLLAAQGVVFPDVFTRANFGGLRNKGFELSADQVINSWLSGFANYSYQAIPEQRGNSVIQFPQDEIGIPPKSRVNVGLNLHHRRYVGSASLNHVDKGFWTDVLDGRYHGYTQAYDLVNASFGVRWSGGRVTTLIKATNILNKDVQEHIFADILKRSVVAELRFSL